MRFLHTSDWHLGRLFHRQHLTDDQAHVLAQLIALARAEKPDAILVSGDIYDRAVPPPEAVRLLDDTLSELVLGLGIPVVVIAGNHDSADRLGFGARLLAERGLHVVGAFDGGTQPVVFEDRHGPVRILPLPFLDPPAVRGVIDDDGIRNQDSAVRAALAAAAERNGRAILMSHLFVQGGSASESERPLSVGGLDTVGLDALAGFHYVALGHLHAPQSVEAGRVEYSGSLLKYSFGEAAHVKGVNLVEMDAQGACAVTRVPLAPRREVRRIEGHLKDLIAAAPRDPGREDYLQVTLLDKGPLLEPMRQVADAYPNALELRRVDFGLPGGDGAAPKGDHRGRSEVEIFTAFFEQVTGEALDEAEASAYRDTVEAMRRREREAS